MEITMRYFTRTAITSALLVLSAGAQAQLAVDDEITYAFFADCADCTLNSGSSQPAALLTLVGYTPGTDLTLENFVSFEYVGSDLVSRFIVGTVDLPNVDPEAYSHSYQIDVWNEVRGTTVYDFGGSIDLPAGPYAFHIEFDDGHRFQSDADGSWFVCATSADGESYYGGTCSHFMNADFGNAGDSQWNAPMAPVPEPSTLLLAGLGLATLAGRRMLRA